MRQCGVGVGKAKAEVLFYAAGERIQTLTESLKGIDMAVGERERERMRDKGRRKPTDKRKNKERGTQRGR